MNCFGIVHVYLQGFFRLFRVISIPVPFHFAIVHHHINYPVLDAVCIGTVVTNNLTAPSEHRGEAARGPRAGPGFINTAL